MTTEERLVKVERELAANKIMLCHAGKEAWL